jgi:hypothetical protein
MLSDGNSDLNQDYRLPFLRNETMMKLELMLAN